MPNARSPGPRVTVWTAATPRGSLRDCYLSVREGDFCALSHAREGRALSRRSVFRQPERLSFPRREQPRGSLRAQEKLPDHQASTLSLAKCRRSRDLGENSVPQETHL